MFRQKLLRALRRPDGISSRPQHCWGVSWRRWHPPGQWGRYDSDRHGGGGAHCFLKGTQILTAQGERPIEDLQIGEMVLTVSGEAKPIKWIGRMRFERGEQGSWHKAVAPIRIARGAFNGDLPHSDLCVSYGHCFLINGLLLSAGDLINGNSITSWQPTHMEVLHYLHIELESHDVILANGAPAETLPGDASHVEFDNFDEYVALYGAALTPQTPYAPIIIARSGRRQALQSHVRGILAPLCDRRQPLDIIRDELARQVHCSAAA
jgi:Hint domain-containing protein